MNFCAYRTWNEQAQKKCFVSDTILVNLIWLNSSCSEKATVEILCVFIESGKSSGAQPCEASV